MIRQNDADMIHFAGTGHPGSVTGLLSPDPFIQSPYSSQSYNGYSYCFNNPLKYIDPLGFVADLTIYDIVNTLWFSGGGYWSSSNPERYLPYYCDYTPSMAGNLEWLISDFYNPSGTGGKSNKYIKRRNEYGYWVREIPADYGAIHNFTLPEVFVTEKWISVKLPYSAQGQGGGKWETVAFGMVNDFVVAIGPLGFSFEIGSFKYKGKDYTITSFGHAMGLDISAGFNAILIKGDPANFSPNDLSGWSGQNNFSIWYLSYSRENPFVPDACGPINPNTYRSNIPGVSVGLTLIGISRVTGYTWITETQGGPSLTDLYKSRPGGY